MKKIFFSSLFFIIGGVIIFLIQKNTCRQIECLVFFEKSLYKEKVLYEKSKTAYRALLEKGDALLRIELYNNLSYEDGKELNQVKIIEIKNAYQTTRSPYAGSLSTGVVCKQKLKPIIKNDFIDGLPIVTIEGFLNKKLQYGDCTEETLLYSSNMSLFYCPQSKQWVQFEIITKRNSATPQNIQRIIESIKCVTPPVNIGSIFP